MVRPRRSLSNASFALAWVVLAVCGVGACAEEIETEAAGSGILTGATGGGEAPPAPILKNVTPLAGSLEITWELTSSCDTIEGERKTALTPYEAAFTVPGTDTLYLDGEANADQAYTYRVRCEAGSIYSAYSNEVTGNPADE